jgi:hypothetical protein
VAIRWVLLVLACAACAVPAEAADGPRALRVVVIDKEGRGTERPGPEPVRIRFRARPSPAELARAKREELGARVAKLAPKAPAPGRLATVAPAARVLGAPVVSAPPSPAPRPSPVVAAAPKPAPTPTAPSDVESDAPLTARDAESLRWMGRLRDKYPDRFARMLATNPRARWLVSRAEQLRPERRRRFESEDEELEDHRARREWAERLRRYGRAPSREDEGDEDED